MKIKFWGTRGSIPTPSTSSFLTTNYGGDTTCVSVEVDDLFIIIDGGSGLRLLGMEMMARQLTQGTFFFTHVHWDHIQGFPFFTPAFTPGSKFDFYGPSLDASPHMIGSVLEKTLRGQQEYLTFPVQLNDMPAEMRFYDMVPGKGVMLAGRNTRVMVSCAPLNHPGGCLGYRFEEKIVGQPDKIFAFITDTEHYRLPNPNVQALARDADVFVYDSQYTDDEYEGKVGVCRVGWGHSTWASGLRECKKANAKKLLLFHHDPMHDDAFLEKLEAEAAAEGAKEGVQIQAAKQFLEIEI